MPFHAIHLDLNAPDNQLATEFADHVGTRPALQVVIELLEGLRALRLPWWTPAQRRAAHPSEQRMRELEVRPDVRQRIMVALTHMPPRASRRIGADMQANLIDEVLEEDVSIEAFEDTFLPAETVAYGDPSGLLREVVAALPWDENTPAHRKLLEIFMDGCLRERTHGGRSLSPFLTWLELRAAIDADAWQEHLPHAVRVKVDRARLEMERASPGVPFSARHELETVGLDTVREHLPLRALAGIFAVALARLDAESGGERSPAPVVPSSHEHHDAEADTTNHAARMASNDEPEEGMLVEDGLESVPADLRPLDPEWNDQYLMVGGIPNDEIGEGTLLPASENPWMNDELTDPGIKAADPHATSRRSSRSDSRRRPRHGA
ncbi:MAG: hypothetical protein Q8P41_17395 [Pseudomonadota bacterium]|nr:hypothetical protein [Pseudomonadota bacterium]